MAQRRFQIDQLIINSPYEEPREHWRYDRQDRMFDRVEGRRPAGYLVASPESQGFDDPGVFVQLPLVNQIRPRVKAWREGGYAGVTGTTRRLLEHWCDPQQRDYRFFFCQLEAIETLIWLTEAPAAERQGHCSIVTVIVSWSSGVQADDSLGGTESSGRSQDDWTWGV